MGRNIRLGLEIAAEGIANTIGELRQLEQQLFGVGEVQVPDNQFEALEKSIAATSAQMEELIKTFEFDGAAPLNLPQIVQDLGKLRQTAGATAQDFDALREASGLTADEFSKLNGQFAAIEKRNTDELAQLASTLGSNLGGANAFADSLGLTAAEANKAAARMRELKTAGATQEETFTALNRELSLTDDQYKAIAAAADRAGDEISETTSQGRGFGAGFGDLTNIANGYNEILQAVMSLKSALAPAYDLLIGSNEKLNQEILASQANLAANMRIFKDGTEVLDVSEKIGATRGAIEEALKQVESDTMSLVGVTSSEVSTVFQTLLTNVNAIQGQSQKIADPIEAAAASTKGWVATMSTLGIPLDQAKQEIQSILNGQVDANSALAVALGITNPMVEDWRAQGILVDELNKKFETYVAANAEAANSITGFTSNIQDVFEIIAREAGKPLLEPIVGALRKMYEWLDANRDSLQAFTEGAIAQFLELGSELADSVLGSLSELAPVIQSVFADGMTGAKSAVDGLLPVVEQIFSTGVGMAKDLMPTLGNIYKIIGNVTAALSPILKIIIQVYGVFQAMLLPVLELVSELVLKVSQVMRLIADAVEPVADILGQVIGKITGMIGLLGDLPLGVLDKVFGGGEVVEAAASGVDGVAGSIDAAAAKFGEFAGLKGGPEVELKGQENAQADLDKLKEAYGELDEAAENAIAEAELSATERENAIKQALVNGTISKRDANEQQLDSDRQRIQAELDAEQAKLAELEAMDAGTGESAEAHEKEIREAKQKTADLAGELLDNELAQQEALADRIIQGLKDQMAAQQHAHDLAVAQANSEIQANELLEASIDRQSRLLNAKYALTQAKGNLEATYSQIALDNVARTLKLQEAAGGKSVALLQLQQKLEDDMAKKQLAALEQEQENERQNLETEIKRNELAAERAVMQAKLNLMESEFGKIQAQNALAQAEAIVDKEERERAIAAAERQLQLSELGIEASKDALENAEAEAGALEEQSELERETLELKQEQARQEAIAAEAARELEQAIALANAKIEEQISGLEKSLDKQQQMGEAQAALAKATSDLNLALADADISRYGQAIELQKELQGEEEKSAATQERIAKAQRKQQQEELAALGLAGKSELELLHEKQAAEDRAAAIKHDALLQEQEFQQRALEIDLQREAIAARRAEIEAEIAASAAQLQAVQAEAKLAAAKRDGNQEAIAAAQAELEISKQAAALTQESVAAAKEQSAFVAEMGESQREALNVQQQQALTEAQQAEDERQFAQARELAGQGVMDATAQARAGDLTKQDFEFRQPDTGIPKLPPIEVPPITVPPIEFPPIPPLEITKDNPITKEVAGLRGDFKGLAATIADARPQSINVNVAPSPGGGEYGGAAIKSAGIG